MKVHNFQVRNAVQLDAGSRRVDLRDEFVFDGLSYDVPNMSASLHWRARTLADAREDLILYFDGVRCLQVERGSDTAPSDGEAFANATDREAQSTQTLNCIGFIRDDPALHWPVIMDGTPPDEWAWTFEFDSGCVYSIDATGVRVEFFRMGRSAVN